MKISSIIIIVSWLLVQTDIEHSHNVSSFWDQLHSFPFFIHQVSEGTLWHTVWAGIHVHWIYLILGVWLHTVGWSQWIYTGGYYSCIHIRWALPHNNTTVVLPSCINLLQVLWCFNPLCPSDAWCMNAALMRNLPGLIQASCWSNTPRDRHGTWIWLWWVNSPGLHSCNLKTKATAN